MPNTLPEAVHELLAWIAQHPDGTLFVSALPQQLRDPDVLTVADSRGLIEFGCRNHIYVGGKLVIERGFDFTSITGPGRIPMRDILSKDTNCEHSELRLRVRLTSMGRTAVAEYRVGQDGETRPAVPKRPSENAFKAWRLRDLTGLRTQQEIADEMSKQLGRTVSQGEVSRWLNDVDAYRKAGGIFPDLPGLRGEPQSIDPNLIEMGERQDHRTARQRQRRDSDTG
jgi:hypothetical protein